AERGVQLRRGFQDLRTQGGNPLRELSRTRPFPPPPETSGDSARSCKPSVARHIQQFGSLDAKGAGNPFEGGDVRAAFPSFKKFDVGAVMPGKVCEFLLRQAEVQTLFLA